MKGNEHTGLVGAALPRREDKRFLVGTGRYVDDMNRPRQLHAYFIRSPHAHAKIVKVDTSAAKQAPGVVAVYTATTPGAAAALAVSMLLITAWACGDRTMKAWAWCGRFMSSV